MKTDFDMTLYLVTDSTYHTEETFYKTIEEACQGGVTLVQLREKNCGGREYLEKAIKVKAITDRYQIPLIIDDRVDVAIACDAAGIVCPPPAWSGQDRRRYGKDRGSGEKGVCGRCGLPGCGSDFPDNDKGSYDPYFCGNTERDLPECTDPCGSNRWLE